MTVALNRRYTFVPGKRQFSWPKEPAYRHLRVFFGGRKPALSQKKKKRQHLQQQSEKFSRTTLDTYMFLSGPHYPTVLYFPTPSKGEGERALASGDLSRTPVGTQLPCLTSIQTTQAVVVIPATT